MTKLDAVNRILRAAREHPVSSIGDSENDSLMAESILDEVDLREQMHGLHCNTNIREYTPDADDNYKIVLPNNTLQVYGWDKDVLRNFAHRVQDGEILLFNMDDDTYQFETDSTVFLRITQKMDFVDLPVQHQFSIADQAAAEYQRAVLGSDSLDRVLTATAARSRAMARAYDARMRPSNIFRNGVSLGPRMGGRMTPRSWPYGGWY